MLELMRPTKVGNWTEPALRCCGTDANALRRSDGKATDLGSLQEGETLM